MLDSFKSAEMTLCSFSCCHLLIHPVMVDAASRAFSCAMWLTDAGRFAARASDCRSRSTRLMILMRGFLFMICNNALIPAD
jgi:hypothetical protein